MGAACGIGYMYRFEIRSWPEICNVRNVIYWKLMIKEIKFIFGNAHVCFICFVFIMLFIYVKLIIIALLRKRKNYCNWMPVLSFPWKNISEKKIIIIIDNNKLYSNS